MLANRTYFPALLLSLALFIAPFSAAASALPDSDPSYEQWIIQTPMSARGRFIFVTKISRRMLLRSLAKEKLIIEKQPVVSFRAEV